MGQEAKCIQQANVLANPNNISDLTRNIYYGEVISVDDPQQGARIIVRIPDLDNSTTNANLPWAYPFLAKFFHVIPKVGELVRVIIEDVNYPQRGRFWSGSIISQPQKIEFDSYYTALSTTNMAISAPEAAPFTYPDAVGVYPNVEDIAVVGRVNTDIILRVNDLEIRAGKHEPDNNLALNKKNPASVRLSFDLSSTDSTSYISNTIVMADRIGIIAHDGSPKFLAAGLSSKDRDRIFDQGHPMARGDVLVQALKIMRDALVQHIHAYSGLPADPVAVANLQAINFDNILQKNIVIN